MIGDSGRMISWARRLWLLAATIGVALAACSSDQRGGENLGSASQALTTEQQRILGFESVGGGSADWTSTSGSISQSGQHVEGNGSLAIANSGNTNITSAALSSLGPIADKLTLDLLLPAAQPNPSWMGTLKLVIECPSQQLYYEGLAEYQLQGRPTGQFLRFEFPLSASTRQKLSTSTYSDLRFKILLNIAQGPGPWLLDRLWVGDAGSSGNGGAGGGAGAGGQPSAGAAGAGAGGTAGSSGREVTFRIVTPKGVSPSDVALGASSTLRINDGVSLLTANTTGRSSASAAGNPGSSYVGVQASLQDLWSIGPVDLRNNATVFGSLTTGGIVSMQPGATIAGAKVENAELLPRNLLSWRVDFPLPNSGSIALEPNVTRVLDPGNYGSLAVKSGAHLKLRRGTYRFEDGAVEPNGHLDIDNTTGPVFIYFRNGLVYSGVNNPQVTTDNVLFGVGSLNGQFSSPWRGILVANGTASLNSAQAAGHEGSLFADHIVLHQWSPFRHRPFVPANFCDPQNPSECGPFCPCGPGGACDSTLECQSGLSCVVGTCRDCSTGGCTGDPCASTETCAPGLVCASGECRALCDQYPDLPECVAPHCANGVQDAGESDVDCGGDCPPCEKGETCVQASDCEGGLTCGTNNGSCLGLARAKSVCWPVQCADGVDASECGQPDSPCGPNCDCAIACDPAIETQTCPIDETCQQGLGQLYGSTADAVCTPVGCPSNDPSKCGTPTSLCGKKCICTPNCSQATRDNPQDGCGGECPHVCPTGEACCTQDVHCALGASCQVDSAGRGVCRPESCAFKQLVPPLCGSSGAPCGEQCPACTPTCDGRECGLDPSCGTSCGSCGAGEFCDASGECAPTTSDDPPLMIPDGNGGQTELEDLPVPVTTPVGAVPGDFSVSDQGTAQYSIPIQVPPGRAGLEPALSLRYVGSRSNGDTGVGWRLEGLSQITRCPKIHALDGYSAPIKNDPSDRFCIDGKRLESVAGVYGENGTEYRTLVDTFAKVVSYSDPDDGLQHPLFPGLTRKERGLQGPDYFRVWLKDGRILTYGRTRDALVTARNGVRSAWMLNRVEDRSGNTIIVGYTALTESRPFQLAEGVPNSVRPSVIAYTGNGNKAGTREVRFAYESRTDDQLTFMQGGSAVMINERLKSITTYVEKAPVRTYRLEYREGNASLLERVYECAGDGSDPNGCKKPTVFDYVEESGFVQGIGDPTFLQGGQLDVDGDGVPDFLTTQAHVGGVAANPWLTGAAIALDVGIAVASYATGPIGGIAINVAWAIVKGPLLGAFAAKPTVTFTSSLQFGDRSRIATPRIISNVNGLACKSAPSFFVDYDQDGRDDVASLCLLNGLRVSRSTGDGHFAAFPSNAPVTTLDVPHPFPAFSPVPPAVLFDLNGDSLQDLVSCKDHYTLEARLRLAPPQGFADPIQIAGAGVPSIPGARLRLPFCSEALPTYRPFDVDGDGAPELVARHTPEVFGVEGEEGWYVLRFARSSTGIPSLGWQRLNLPDVASKIPGFGSSGLGSSSTGENMVLADVNGDGLADIWRGDSSDEATVWLNTGNNRFLTTNVAHPRPTYDFDPQFRLRTTALVDHDADGRLDILEHWENRKKVGFAASDNTVLKLGWNPVSLAADYPVPDLFFTTPDASGFGPGDIKSAGDIDGDGNVDLFGPGQIFYGSGLKNMLLSKVTDGQGKVINVAYDGLLDTYRNECGSSSTWPEICLKQMKGLVSSHTEGFVFADQQGTSREQVDRTYRYTYTNARMNVTGHGWLGFDRRTATLTLSTGNEFHSVTTEFWPVERFRPSAVTPTTATSPPYLYPLVGLPLRVTTDQGMTDGQVNGVSPLEDGGHTRRNVIHHNWKVEQSADARPFPVLRGTTTESYSRRALGPLDAPSSENGALRSSCSTSMQVDDYGNLTRQSEQCQPVGDAPELESGLTTTTFNPNRSAWLIGNPERVTKTHSKSFRTNGGLVEEHEQTQVFLTEYDAVGRVTGTTRDPDGQADKTTYFRDSLGNIERIVESSNGQAARTTTVTFDNDGVFPTKVTNAKGHTTEVHYDKRFGALHKLVDPNGLGVVHAYDALGLLHDTSGPSGLTTLTYAQGPAASGVETPAGTIFPVLEVSIERRGLDGTHGGATAQELDPYGRLVRTRSQGFDGAEVITEQAYDAKGRVAAATAPHLTSSSTIPGVRYTHDYLDRTVLVEHTQTTGNSTAVTASRQHQFGSGVSLANGRTGLIAALDDCPLSDVYCGVDVELTIDEEGKQNAVVKDHRGNIIRSVDGQNIVSLDHASHYQYGAFNRLRSFRDNANAWHSLVHDPYGRLLIHADADTGATVSEYNGFSELTKTTDPKGQVRQYQYDVLGRLIRIDDPAGATRWVYDEGVSALGQLSQTISPATPQNPQGQQVRYTYEAATPDRHRALPSSIEHLIDGASYVTELTYDDLSRLDTVAYPALGTEPPIVAKYDYDAASAALAAVREIGSGTSRPIWRIDSAHEGHLIAQETFGNGATTSLTYDPDRRFLTSLRTTLGPDTIQDLAYSHYANGQIHERITPAKTEELNYDPLGRLSSVRNVATGSLTSYAYDHHGNLTRRGTTDLTYRPGYPHLVQNVGPNTYNHDASGNVSQRSGPDIPGGNQTFQYTPFDLPKIVTTGTGLATRVAEFDYTADGNRAVRREILGGDGSRHFVGDLYQRLVSSGGTTLEQRYRLFAGSRTVAEIRRGPFGDETYYFHQDHQGSPQTISNDNAIAFRQEFDAFGLLQGIPPEPNQELTRAGFTGHDHDYDLGVVDMGGRVYDPVAGQFMSADPIMQAPFWSQGLNRWAYVFNDPVNLTDPSGFMTSQNAHDAAGAVGVLAGNPFSATAIAVLAQGAGAGLAVSALGGIGNLGVTGVMNPFGGSAGGTYNVATPSSAPKTAATSRNSLDPASQRAQPGPGTSTVAGQGRTRTYQQAACGGPGNPTCGGQRRFGTEAMDRVILDFINARSRDPVYTTIAESIVQGGPEHGAPIIQSADGSLRLGEISMSGADSSTVHIDYPRLPEGERYVGQIHSHPGSSHGLNLGHSEDMDVPGLRTLMRNLRPNPRAFRSYVVAVGKGPYFGAHTFEVVPHPGRFVEIIP